MKKILIIYMVCIAQPLLLMERPEAALIPSPSTDDKIFTKFSASVLNGDLKSVKENISNPVLVKMVEDESNKKTFQSLLSEAQKKSKQPPSFKDQFIVSSLIAGTHVISLGIAVVCNELMCNENDSVTDSCFWKSVAIGSGPLLAGTWYGFRRACRYGIIDSSSMRKMTFVSMNKIQECVQIYELLNTFASNHKIHHNENA